MATKRKKANVTADVRVKIEHHATSARLTLDDVALNSTPETDASADFDLSDELEELVRLKPREGDEREDRNRDPRADAEPELHPLANPYDVLPGLIRPTHGPLSDTLALVDLLPQLQRAALLHGLPDATRDELARAIAKLAEATAAAGVAFTTFRALSKRIAADTNVDETKQ